MGLDVSSERAARKRQEEYDAILPPAAKRYQIHLDCKACRGDKTMVSTKAKRFGGGLRFIGYLIAFPSVLGFIASIMTVVASFRATNEVMAMSQEAGVAAGAAIGGGLGITFGLFMAGMSLIGGTVGYVLLSFKKVYRCKTCGFILDRA